MTKFGTIECRPSVGGKEWSGITLLENMEDEVELWCQRNIDN